ncbi:PAS domain S-box protein [Frateuria edaphi]|uniref:PAS domain S-box protein n=1 Tax=Frateuria edaphi TaxID=2898793 RepID=UPI001E29C826|nr:PAS domain S-box protein [Frateuria edaphi]UGB44602.1 PAS domain S-box protein [Frateuria edaphi]
MRSLTPSMRGLLPGEQATVLGQLREGVILTDREGRITFINEAAGRFLGVSQLGVLPVDYSRVFHLLTEDGQPYPAVDLPLARAVRGETVPHARWSIQREDGTQRIAGGAAQPLFDAEGVMTGAVLTFHDDTARVQAERALSDAEQRYRLATEATEDAIWDWNPRTDRTAWNERLFEAYGHRYTETSYAWFISQIHPDDRGRIDAGLREVVHAGGGIHWTDEYRFRRADGTYAKVCDRGTVARDAQGRAIRMIGAMVDVTERKRADRALRRRTRTLEILNRTAAEMAAELDLPQVVQLATEAGVELTRASMGAFLSETLDEAAGGTRLCALAGIDRDAFGSPAKTRVAELFGPVIAHRRLFRSDDVTVDPRIAHEAMSATPAPIRSVLAVPVTSRCGEPLGALVFVHPEPARFKARHERLMVGVAAHAAIAIDNARLLATAQREVEERRIAQERLRDLNETLEARVEARTRERDRAWAMSRDLQLVMDATGIILAANEASDILGYRPDELIGRSAEAFVHPDDVAIHLEAMSMAALDRFPPEEIRCLHKDGSYRWLSWVKSADQGVLYASGRDVTQQKEQAQALAAAEEALRQSQKMEAVGQLTGGIAHDFNNMLAVVMGSLDLLKRRVGDNPRAVRQIESATDAAGRAALLTKRLLAFSRQQALNPQPIDPNRLVGEMSELLRHSIGAGIRLHTTLADGLWPIRVDANQLENVLLNLAVNARDAMPDGGCLTIETGNVQLDKHYAAANGIRAGDYVLIAVTDNGSGMPPDVLARAFDPFFTTKEVGKGTGLGLSQVYGFVRQSGGHVKLYSEPGQGTTVRIYLPRLREEPAAGWVADSDPATAPGGLQELILVVEDEPSVRQFSVDALEELGYRVLQADGAPAALRLLDRHPDVALLFTDIVMPEINGRKLADEVHHRRPELPILFTTGYTRDAVVHQGVLDPDVELLGKPFTIDELARKVRAMLDGGE